jgi:hypothetical protein
VITVTLLKSSVSSSIRKILTTLSQEVGIIMLWFGILDNKVQLDPFMDHTFVEIQLIYMTVIFLLVLIQTPDSCNYGTLVLASQSKISLGMKVFLQKKLAKFTALNSKRTQEISLSLVVVEPTKLKCLMETTCSNHAPRSKTLVELLSLLISVIKEICSLAVEVMVSLESSMLLMKSELLL